MEPFYIWLDSNQNPAPEPLVSFEALNPEKILSISLEMSNTLAFTNGYICYGGTLLEKTLWVDIKSGLIIDQPEDGQNQDVYDLQGEILAPAFLELQTNGCAGFHFTQFTEPDYYEYRLFKVSRYLLSTGVGGFWATIPTVSSKVFKDVSCVDLDITFTPKIL
jgi:hypothetical protein